MPVLTIHERIGTTLANKYRLDRLIGRGGFGGVYAGVHAQTGREIAVKVLNHEAAEQEEFAARFLQEARAAASLNHPNVVDVLDLGDDGGTIFIVLELLKGEDLSSLLHKRAPLSVDETLAILMPVMHALALAHRRGIIHRDLKPGNIFIHTDMMGETVPKLLDFGIAKMSTGGRDMTTTGAIIGTPRYMAPEQARGSKEIGPPADVWSMGVVLWQCVTGTVPYDADSPTGVLVDLLTRHPPPVRSVMPNLPSTLADAIDGALVYEHAHRIPHMGALIGAIEGRLSLPAPAPVKTGARPWMRALAVSLAVAALAAGSAVGLAIGGSLGGDEPGLQDAGVAAAPNSGPVAAFDAGQSDAGESDLRAPDAGAPDTGEDAGSDAGPGADAGIDGGAEDESSPRPPSARRGRRQGRRRASVPVSRPFGSNPSRPTLGTEGAPIIR